MNRWLVLFLFSVGFSCKGQVMDTLPGSLQISARIQYGFIVAHRPTVHHLQQKHTKGFELEFARPLNGKDDWQQPFLLPSYSAAYQYIDLGTDHLGSGHALTARLIFPLTTKRNINTAISAGLGLGYIEKKYDRYENFKNVAIGSHLNAVVAFSFRTIIKSGKRSLIDFGISFTHFSNGSVKPPNLGINIPALQLGYTHYLGKPLKREFRTIAPVSKKAINKLFVAAGLKGVDLAKGLNIYGITGITYHHSMIISHKSRIGAGVDAYYDRSLLRKLENLKKETVPAHTSYRAGLFATYNMTAGRIIMLFENGIYIIDRYKEDGLLYTRVGVEYMVTKSLLAGFHLKSHFAKADFFEYGIGYIF